LPAADLCTLPLHDALPISPGQATARAQVNQAEKSSAPASSSRASTFFMAPTKSFSGPPQRAEKMPGWPSRAVTDRPESSASAIRSEEHTSELQSRENLVCR